MFSKLAFFLFFLTCALQAQVAWVEQNLTQTIGNLNSNGASVAMDGEWLAVGTYNPADTKSCAVFMYKYDYATMSWPTTPAFTLGDAGGNCNGNKGFGAAISLSGTRLAVGLEDYGNQNLGAFTAYNYGVDNKGVYGWYTSNALSQIKAPDAQANSKFGTSLSIKGNYLVVGAPYQDTLGHTDNGEVYLYDFDNLIATTTPLAWQTGSFDSELFGSSVTSDGNNVLVGSPGYDSNGFTDNGLVTMFEYNDVTSTLDLTSAWFAGGVDAGGFGSEVALSGTIALGSGSVSYGLFNEGGLFTEQLAISNALNGDVSISDGKSAFAYKDRSVVIYPDLQRDYYLQIKPGGSVTDYAEDISFYKDQLVASDFNSHVARVYQLPCGTGYELTENEWAMVGIPCQIPAGTTVVDAFNHNVSPSTDPDADLGTYNTNWWVYEQNSTYGTTTKSYKLLAETDVVDQSKGYWIYTDRNATTRVDTSISSTRTDTNSSWTVVPADVGTQSIVTLPDGNATVLIHNNLPRSFHWGNVVIKVSGTYALMSSGAASSVLQNATAYVYDATSTSGQPYRAIAATPGLGDTIEAGQGFWVKVLAPYTGVELALPYEK